MTIVRGLFVLVMVTTHWIVGVSSFEKSAATAIATVALIAIGYFLVLLARREFVATVGLLGCFVDIVILSVLPLIWYLSVGGADVPPAYMLKTQITVVTLGLVALNALAIRPLYPVLVAVGGVAIHLALLLYVLHEPRTIVSSDFVDSAMGSAISVEFVLTSMLIVAVTGAGMGYLT